MILKKLKHLTRNYKHLQVTATPVGCSQSFTFWGSYTNPQFWCVLLFDAKFDLDLYILMPLQGKYYAKVQAPPYSSMVTEVCANSAPFLDSKYGFCCQGQ